MSLACYSLEAGQQWKMDMKHYFALVLGLGLVAPTPGAAQTCVSQLSGICSDATLVQCTQHIEAACRAMNAAADENPGRRLRSELKIPRDGTKASGDVTMKPSKINQNDKEKGDDKEDDKETDKSPSGGSGEAHLDYLIITLTMRVPDDHSSGDEHEIEYDLVGGALFDESKGDDDRDDGSSDPSEGSGSSGSSGRDDSGASTDPTRGG